MVNSVANFINARSGVTLSQAVKNRLITLTQTVYQGRPRKTIWDVTGALSDTWFERVGQLTDVQIQEVGGCTRAAVDIPVPPNTLVQARISGQLTVGDMTTWMSTACAYRDASTPEAVTARANTPGAIYGMLDQRLLVYEQALPGQRNRTVGFTPTQTFLLGYALVTDDYLYYSSDDLTSTMQALEAYIHQKFPSVQTACVNRKAYGYMEYLYSTHTTYLFNETVQNRLIDRL